MPMPRASRGVSSISLDQTEALPSLPLNGPGDLDCVMDPISFRDRKLFRMGHSKKMRWTAAALIGTFLVLATDALGYPL